MRLMQFQAVLHDDVVATDLAYFQPGKSASLSLFPHRGVPLQNLWRETTRLSRNFGDEFAVELAATCVNVIVRGIDKAEGVRWLSRQTSIPLHEMAGIGDSPSDVAFMQLAAWSVAPANAHETIKQIAHYTSPYEDGLGLVDILARLPRT
jgi:hydroxymethylpyrimidine pyrophosphatase-like HAD family hydrolase